MITMECADRSMLTKLYKAIGPVKEAQTVTQPTPARMARQP
ncbi:hypothetical protein [Streptomyces ferrugineus]|nr:hypothetical protein [Streptomyces ferrugineus]